MNCGSLAACKYDKTVMWQGRNPTTDGSNSPNQATGSLSRTLCQ